MSAKQQTGSGWADVLAASGVAVATVVGWAAAQPLRWLLRFPHSTITHPEWHACCESSNLLSWPRVAAALALPVGVAASCGWLGARRASAAVGATIGVVLVWFAIRSYFLDGVIPPDGTGRTYAKALAAVWPVACLGAAALGRRLARRRDDHAAMSLQAVAQEA